MKYKEKYYVNRWGWTPLNIESRVYELRFRYDPVPRGIGHRMRGGIYRKIRTTQERRWSIAHKEYVRGRRSSHMIPDYWDDIIRKDYRDRSWKKCTKRKHQYKRSK